MPQYGEARDRRRRAVVAFACAIGFSESACFAILAPLLPELGRQLDTGKVGAGLLMTAYPAALVLAAVPSARSVRRFGASRVAVAAVVLLALSSVLFGVSSSFGMLLTARALQGVAGMSAWVGSLAWLWSVVPAQERGGQMGRAFGFMFAGSTMAPAVGALASYVDRGAVFGVLALLLAAVAIVGARLAGEDSPGAREEVHGWIAPPRRRGLALGLTTVFVVGLVTGGVQVLAPLRIDVLGGGAALIAVLFLAASAPQIVLSPLIGRLADRRGPEPVIAVSFAGCIVALFVLGLAETLVVVAAALTVALIAAFAAWTPATLLAAHGAGSGNRSPVQALSGVFAAWALGAATGALVLSAMAARHGDASAFALSASVMAPVAVLCLRRSMRAPTRLPSS